MKISACLITKNESANIARCLESIPKTVDEIIVADTGSTDDTVLIAQSYGARIFHYKWDNNFSNAKNYALDKAAGDWIIFLDADEYFDSETQKNLPGVLKKMDSRKVDAVQCRMIHTDGFQGKVISENPSIRIFRNNQIRFSGSVHEKLLKNGKPLVCLFLTNVHLVIYHTGYALNELQHKFRRNLAYLQELERTCKLDHDTLYYLSSTYNSLGNHEKAIQYAMRALEDPRSGELPFAYKLYVFLIKGMLQLQDKYSSSDIEPYLARALELYPNHPEIHYVQAIFYKAKNQYHAAIESYSKALQCHRDFDHNTLNDFPMRLEEVYRDLGYLNNIIGNAPDAVEYYYQALKINKYNAQSLASLYSLIKDQKVEEIVFFLNSIYNREDEKDLTFLCKVLINLNEQAAGHYYSLWDAKFNNK